MLVGEVALDRPPRAQRVAQRDRARALLEVGDERRGRGGGRGAEERQAVGLRQMSDGAVAERALEVPEPAGKWFYISGPKPMVDAVQATLEELGAPTEAIKRDAFPGYD